MRQPDNLETLNPEQQLAADHGLDLPHGAGADPLLVIAGAGSGKTNTLAHRVARLLAAGADPGRILLLTFSRRAAVEMTRRVERIVAKTLGANRPAAGAGVSWAGTFHGIAARLLRIHATRIGLPPGFTILDREDAADLLDLARHDLGLSKKEARFPRKTTCLAIYSHTVNAQAPLGVVLGKAFPWCAMWGFFDDFLAGQVAFGCHPEASKLKYTNQSVYFIPRPAALVKGV